MPYSFMGQLLKGFCGSDLGEIRMKIFLKTMVWVYKHSTTIGDQHINLILSRWSWISWQGSPHQWKCGSSQASWKLHPRYPQQCPGKTTHYHSVDHFHLFVKLNDTSVRLTVRKLKLDICLSECLHSILVCYKCFKLLINFAGCIEIEWLISRFMRS